VCPVYVHNAGHPALYDMATVHISVRDINDNAPVFAATSTAWTLDVPENANMAAIHTVEAYDADVGDNARISYSISGMILCADIQPVVIWHTEYKIDDEAYSVAGCCA